MRKLADAKTKLERVEKQAEKTRQGLYVAIREAHAAGESVGLIATVAGLSRQRVWQIVKEGNNGDRDS